MWRGMWSAPRSAGGDDDEERKRCVAADAARKHSARRYTNRGLEPPASLPRRETEEYDRRQARLSGASSSRTPLPPVKREAEEIPPLCAVKREPEAERPRAGVVGPEDYLPPPRRTPSRQRFSSAVRGRRRWRSASGGTRRSTRSCTSRASPRRGSSTRRWRCGAAKPTRKTPCTSTSPPPTMTSDRRHAAASPPHP